MQVVRIPPPSADHPAPAPGTAAGSWAEQEHEVLAEVNRRRASARLTALAGHPALDALAREHSEAMARGARGFGHGGFEGRQQEAAQAVAMRAIAENVASMPVTPSHLVTATVGGWMNSPGHRANLLGQFDLAGTGVALASDGSFYITQIYVRTAR